MRKLARSIARDQMRRMGFQRINKKHANGRSFFSENWRKFVDYPKGGLARRA